MFRRAGMVTLGFVTRRWIGYMSMIKLTQHRQKIVGGLRDKGRKSLSLPYSTVHLRIQFFEYVHRYLSK